MNSDRVKREDWTVGGLALLLVIDLLELPWHEVGGGTVSGIALPAISNRATGPPDGFFGVLAVLATLAIIADLLFEHLSPDTQIPAVDGSRTLTRFVLAITAAGLLAVKFILNISEIGNLGSGFWFGVLVAAGLVYASMKAWEAEPHRTARAGRAAPPTSEPRDPRDGESAQAPEKPGASESAEAPEPEAPSESAEAPETEAPSESAEAPETEAPSESAEAPETPAQSES
jgi:hypothetical protein